MKSLTFKLARTQVANAVLESDVALYEGLKALGARQTEIELGTKSTKDQNGNGFYPRDAKLLTEAVAEVNATGVIADEAKRKTVRIRLSRYERQLTETIANTVGILIVPAKRGRPAKAVVVNTTTELPLVEAVKA